MLLSKSQYIRGLQCHKSLWLYKRNPKVRSKPDHKAESLFNIGNTVGSYAIQLFPGGVEIKFDAKDFDGMIRKTTELIEKGVETIYEATFKENGIFAMADVLQKTDDGWNIYEVKASTSTKAYHVNDAAIQYFSLSKVLKINKVFIVHINNQYVRDGDLDINALFTIDDITDSVLSKQAEIPAILNSIEPMLKSDMPDIDIGPHCSAPYECDFHKHCWKHIPKPSVFNLYGMNWSKKFALYNQGHIHYGDVIDRPDLNTIQRLQVESSATGKPVINKGLITDFLNTIEYPISFFDFETFQNVIPRFDGQRPYMQMPFQYSLHIVESGGQVSHKEYLADEHIDPRRVLCEAMLRDISATGSIIAFNQSFEISRINELAILFPDLSSQLLALTKRFQDLLEPFRSGSYYHPDFNGSFSIKSVLPALFPEDNELDYNQLEIQNGGMAMDIFANLHNLKDPEQCDQIRKNLLAYCHLDTLAMVRIWEKLYQTVN